MLKALGKKAEAGVVKEYRARMSMEFDYETEGRTMNTVAEFFEGGPSLHSGITSRVAVPKSYPDLSTRRLLVMDYFEGSMLSRGSNHAHGLAAAPTTPTALNC